MKITLDTQIPGSHGLTTLREAVTNLRTRDLACHVDPEVLDIKLAHFAQCVEYGFTPLRSEIMAAYYVASRDEAEAAFERGLITESELWQRRADVSRLVLGA
ncbi:hypothetical protein [Nonomuraea sp. NPDC050310]|uniref:hypothetical protein n=1 Tax=unclassified Nonomuraea TaxID=2593643 RepID=UPI0033C745D4